MEGLLNSIKGMFMKEDGGIKWTSLIGIGAGAAVGGLLLPALIPMEGFGLIAAAGGALVGLMGSQLLGGSGPESGETAPGPVAAAGGPSAVVGHGHGQAQSMAPTPGSIPQNRAQGPTAGRS